MSRTLLVAVVLLLSSAPVSALAAEGSTWGTTFPADALATHLGDTPARYMLVPAGTDAPELTQAEEALAVALRASGKALLVMNAQALGAVARLDDAAIAQRGAGFPVDRVMVLRLFPDASGALTQAVVTLYDTTGQSRGSFSVVAGTALAARTLVPPPQAAAVPQSITPPPAPKSPAPPTASNVSQTEQYEQQYIGFDELVAVNAGTGAVVSQWTVPYVGKFKKPLEGDAFYKLVGRKDLVQSYQDKVNTKTFVSVLGGAAMLGGGILALTAITADDDEDCSALSPGFSACFERNRQRFDEHQTTTLVGIGIAGVGIGVLSWGLLMNPHPVTSSEARELADGYNKQLKGSLGLSEDGTPVQPAAPPSTPTIQARLSPVLGLNGAGLRLSGTF